jgi:hypothetical protein
MPRISSVVTSRISARAAAEGEASDELAVEQERALLVLRAERARDLAVGP